MSDQQFERAVSDWLGDGSDRTPRHSIDGVLLAIKTTPQERDLGIPWRMPRMPAFTRATGIAAVALVAVVSAGGLIYLNSKAPSGTGGGPTAPPTTQGPSTGPTQAPSPAASYLAPGITGWNAYNSAVYGLVIDYPSDWSVDAPATEAWKPGQAVTADAWPWADVFGNPEAVDGDEIGMLFWQAPAPAGTNLRTWQGMQDAIARLCQEPTFRSCTFDSPPTPMCIGVSECLPVLIASIRTGDEVTPWGFIGYRDAGLITVFEMGRPDNFPAAARYGGTMALLRSILTAPSGHIGVRPPKPGETPYLEGD
jgi:hypothetical protein